MKGKRILSDIQIVEIVNYMLENEVSGSEMARKHGIPSSSFFGCLNRRLPKIDKELYEKYKEYAKFLKDTTLPKNRIKYVPPKIFSDEQIVEIVNYILENNVSGSDMARKHNLPTSTFFGNIKRHLPRIDEDLYKKYKEYAQYQKDNVDYNKVLNGKRKKFNDQINNEIENKLKEIGWIQNTDEEDM